MDNYKVWIKSLMVMLGASYKPITSRIRLDWALECPNALDIYVVRMIIVLYISVLLCVMKFLGVEIIDNFRYLGAQCLTKSPIYTISCKFYDSSPTYL
jgi:hypothetical protein